MRKRPGFAAILFFVAAALAMVMAKHFDVNAVVLKTSLIDQPVTGSASFTLRIAGQCRIGVECARDIPADTVKGFLEHGNLVDVRLHRGGELVNLSYFPPVQASSNLDSSNQFGNLNFGTDTIGQDIAYFSGRSGEKYEVSYTIIRPLDAIKGSKPALIVYFDTKQTIGWAFFSTAMLVTSCILLILGIVGGIRYFLLWRRTE